MHLSYWEYKHWFSNIDYAIIGSGIVGLSCALELRRLHPKARIVILEKGVLPQGASTKNAGFACFGSISEILSDLETHTEQEVIDLVRQRISGIEKLKKQIGIKALQYKPWGGYEVFSTKDKAQFENCVERLPEINKMLSDLFPLDVFRVMPDIFDFKNIQPELIFNAFEGQIDTGAMMQALIRKAQRADITILNGVQVSDYVETTNDVRLLANKFEIQTKEVLIATNGFARELDIEEVKPARAQVLITKPIKALTLKGTFHLDQGYYYFRNIDDRILLGGGRNLDFKAEETTDLSQTDIVQNELERLLNEVILPETPFEIDTRWSGVMGVGTQKKPILKSLSSRVHCGVRLGGMGVAIGSEIGYELAQRTL